MIQWLVGGFQRIQTSFNAVIYRVREGVTNTAVVPSTASLSVSTFIPVIATAIIPSTAAVSLSSFAPAIQVGGNLVLIPNTATLTTTTFAPTVQAGGNVVLVPNTLSISTTKFAPTATVFWNNIDIFQANLQHGEGTDGVTNYQRQLDVLTQSGVVLVTVQERGTSDTGWNSGLASAGFTEAIYRENDSSQGDGPAIWYKSSDVTILNTYYKDLSEGAATAWSGFTNVDKAAVAAKVRISGVTFYIVSTHLAWSAGADSSGSTYSAIRVAQIAELIKWILTTLNDGYDIVIGGDMNFGPDYPKSPSGLQVEGITDYNFRDEWAQALNMYTASASWGDRDSDGVTDMPVDYMLTRTHDTRRIDYFFLKRLSKNLTLLSMDIPDLRATCSVSLTGTPKYCPDVQSVQRWGISDDFGVRPSDHNWVKIKFGLSGDQAVVHDSVTDSNGVLLQNHTGETVTWSLHPNDGAGASVVIDSNRLTKNSSANASLLYSSGTTLGTDFFIEAHFSNLSSVSANAGITFCMSTSADTYYNFRYNQGNGLWEFRVTVAGSATGITTYADTFSAGQDRYIRIEKRQGVFNFWINEVHALTNISDSTLSSGRVGVRMAGAASTSTGLAIYDIVADILPISVVPAAISLVTSGYAPTIALSANKVVVPDTVSLVTTRLAPTVSVAPPIFIGAAVETNLSENPQTVSKFVNAGNLLIWLWWSGSSSAPLPTPSDGINVWTQDSNSPLSSVDGSTHGCKFSFWYAIAKTTGVITVTASTGEGSYDSSALLEYSGFGPRDTSAKAISAAGNTTLNGESTPSVTTTKDNALVVSFIFNDNNLPVLLTWVPGYGFYGRPEASNDPGGGSGITWHVEDVVNVNVGAITPTWTALTTDTYCGYTLAFQPATYVVPDTTTLTTTNFAPTVTVTSGQVVIPSTAVLVTSTLVPVIASAVILSTVSLGITTFSPVLSMSIIPSTASLTSTTFTPTTLATDNQWFVTSPAAIVTVTFAPSSVTTANQLLVPDTALLTTNTFAPSEKFAIIPAAGTLVTSSFTPLVLATANQWVVPDIATLTISSYVPAASVGTVVVPNTASISTSTFAPSINATANQWFVPETANVTLTSFTATVNTTDHQWVVPDTKVLTLTSFAPSVIATANQWLVPATSSISVSTFASTILATANQWLIPVTATLSCTRFAPLANIDSAAAFIPSPASLTTTGLTPTIAATAHQWLVPNTGTLTLLGFVPVLKSGFVTDTGTLSVTGLAPTTIATANQVFVPNISALITTKFVPSVPVTNNKTFTPNAASLTMLGLAPITLATSNKWFVPDTSALTATTFSPEAGISNNIRVVPDVVQLLMASFTPAIDATTNLILTPDALPLTLIGFSPLAISSGQVEIIPDVAQLFIQGYAPKVGLLFSGEIVNISMKLMGNVATVSTFQKGISTSTSMVSDLSTSTKFESDDNVATIPMPLTIPITMKIQKLEQET